MLHLVRIDIVRGMISLPFLEIVSNSRMTVILFIRLILVVLDLDKVAIDRLWIKAQRHEGIDGSRCRNQPKRPSLFILELDQIGIVLGHLVSLILAVAEQLGQTKPLTRHLEAIIRIDKLVIVNAIRSVPLDSVNRRLAAVQGDNVVNQGLSLRRERQGFGFVGRVVCRIGGLARLKVFAGGVAGDGGSGHGSEKVYRWKQDGSLDTCE